LQNKIDLQDVELPLETIAMNSDYFPKTWGLLNYCEMMLLEKVFPENIVNSQKLEHDTIGQANNKLWMKERALRITSSQAHKIIIRKKNYDNLAKSLIDDSNNQKFPKFVKDAMAFGTKYESVAKSKFFDYMTFQLKRKVMIRETGLVVQPYLFWLGASPDGLLIDNTLDCPVLIEIKCPYTKRHLNPNDIINNEKFYVNRNDDSELYLKKEHQYYCQVQMAMGLSQISMCVLIVYTFKGLIVNFGFDEKYFLNLVVKLNDFYRKYLLPLLL